VIHKRSRVNGKSRLQCLGVLLLLVVGLLGLRLFPLRRVGAAADESNLRLRSLEIIDSAGVARLRLGAPVPDPMTDGKTSPRRSPQSGIQFNDARGNEIGGLGMLDDGSIILCFDTHSSEATCMYVLPSGERGFSVTDDHGKDRAVMVLNADKSVSVSLNDERGKPKAAIRLGKGAAPEIQLTTSDGKLLWTTPHAKEDR
jgi:hypothetical protein